jgi:hypothetical protein
VPCTGGRPGRVFVATGPNNSDSPVIGAAAFTITYRRW